MPKQCLCEMIPDMLERIEALENSQRHHVDPHMEKQLEQREMELNERFDRNAEKKKQLEELAQKLIEEMKLIDQIQPTTKVNEATQQLQQQREAIANMEKLFGASSKFFAEMYGQISGPLDLPQLEGADKPTAILIGLENIIKGIGNLAKKMQPEAK